MQCRFFLGVQGPNNRACLYRVPGQGLESLGIGNRRLFREVREITVIVPSVWSDGGGAVGSVSDIISSKGPGRAWVVAQIFKPVCATLTWDRVYTRYSSIYFYFVVIVTLFNLGSFRVLPRVFAAALQQTIQPSAASRVSGCRCLQLGRSTSTPETRYFFPLQFSSFATFSLSGGLVCASGVLRDIRRSVRDGGRNGCDGCHEDVTAPALPGSSVAAAPLSD